MKNRSKLLIASLFAGLSLGVLSGVKLVTKDNIEPLETNAAGTGEFWVPINDLSNFPNETPVMFAAKCGNTWYRLTALSGKQAGKNEVASFSPTVYSCADGDVLQASSTLLDTNHYFYLYTGGDTSLTTSKYIVFKDWSTHYRTHRATDCGWSVSGYSYYNIFANGTAGGGNCDNNTKYTISGGYPINVGETVKNLPIYAFKDSSSGTPYFVIASNTAASKKTYAYQAKLYAKVSSYNTITLDYNDGSDKSGSVRAFKYMKFQNANVPTRTGYTFNGYWTAKTNGTQMIDKDGKGKNVWTGTNDVTYFAHWSVNSYTVSYKKGTYGTGDESSVSYTYGNNVTTKGAIFTRTGYTQKGWSKAAAGNTNDYALNTSVNFGTSGATLYPFWEANKYTITFDGAGGELGTSSIPATYGSKVPSITLPSKSGYSFGGFYTEEDGTGTQYYDSTGASMQTYSLTSGITLYAIWTPNTYHVSLDSQGGFEGSTVVDTVFDQPVPAVTVPTKLGHIFKGYYSELNGAGIQYINSDGSSTGIPWTTPSDNTIYGYWEPIKINITIIVNDATNPGTTSASVYYGSEMPYITPATRTGYKLLGYFDAQEGGTLIYSAEGYGHGACELLEDITIYAQWEKIVNTITFDQRGGNGGTTSIAVSYGETVEDVTLPNKQYFTFKGYYDYANGEGTQYFFEDGTPVNSIWARTTDVTVYAYWVKTMNNFAREFLEKTDGGIYCDKSKGLDKSIQDDLLASFNIINDEEGLATFKNTERIIGMTSGFENDIVEAKSRYCYMVEELGINDFLGLGIGPVNRSLGIKMNTLFGITEEDVPEVTTLGVLTVAGGISIGAYFLFKKKKFN